MDINKKLWSKKLDNYLLMDYIESFINIVAYKSITTAEHCIRVGEIALEIGKACSLSSKEMEDLFIGSMLHDIGKVFIPEKILNKPNRLTENEYKAIKEHSQDGYDFLFKCKHFRPAANIILHHHERYDGKGYPYGLKGSEIPFLSRIVSIADSFDAMISIRPYKRTMSIDEAAYEIEKNKNRHFDEEVASTFLKIIHSNEFQKSIVNFTKGVVV